MADLRYPANRKLFNICSILKYFQTLIVHLPRTRFTHTSGHRSSQLPALSCSSACEVTSSSFLLVSSDVERLVLRAPCTSSNLHQEHPGVMVGPRSKFILTLTRVSQWSYPSPPGVTSSRLSRTVITFISCDTHDMHVTGYVLVMTHWVVCRNASLSESRVSKTSITCTYLLKS